jgi:hypothetical protein
VDVRRPFTIALPGLAASVVAGDTRRRDRPDEDFDPGETASRPVSGEAAISRIDPAVIRLRNSGHL